MIEIHWLWLPLIITGLTLVLAFIANGGKSEIQTESGFALSMLAALIGFVSSVIYIAVGLYWLVTHIKITS